MQNEQRLLQPSWIFRLGRVRSPAASSTGADRKSRLRENIADFDLPVIFRGRHKFRNARLVRIAHHQAHAFERRQFLRRALRVAAGDQNARARLLAMDTPDHLPHFIVRGCGHGAGVQHHQVGVLQIGGRRKALRGEASLNRRAIGLRRPAPEILDEKTLHCRVHCRPSVACAANAILFPGSRMRQALFRIALGLCAFALHAQNKRAEAPTWDAGRMDMQAPPPQGVAVRAGRLFDPKSGANLVNQVILIKGDRIIDVGPAAKIQIPPGAQVIDLSRATVLPGLIDAHVHLIQGPDPNDSRASFIGLHHALKDLNAGFTTIQDMNSRIHVRHRGTARCNQ